MLQFRENILQTHRQDKNDDSQFFTKPEVKSGVFYAFSSLEQKQRCGKSFAKPSSHQKLDSKPEPTKHLTVIKTYLVSHISNHTFCDLISKSLKRNNLPALLYVFFKICDLPCVEIYSNIYLLPNQGTERIYLEKKISLIS